MKKAMRGEKGFTLLEAVIVLSLLGLVGLSFAYLFSISQRSLIQSANFASSQTDASFALEHIKRHLITATAVAAPAAGAAGSTLEFTWQPTAAAAERTSRYELNGTELRFIADITSADAFEVIARGIQAVTFDRAAAGRVSVEVLAQRTSGGDTRQMRLQTNISPRGLFQ